MNLILRFFLELAALAGIGVATFQVSEGVLAYLFTPIAVLIAATIWGVFNVPGDPSRSGHAPVAISGVARLILELIILFGGSFAFYLAGYVWIGLSHAGLTVLHYTLSGQRLRWLLKQ